MVSFMMMRAGHLNQADSIKEKYVIPGISAQEFDELRRKRKEEMELKKRQKKEEREQELPHGPR